MSFLNPLQMYSGVGLGKQAVNHSVRGSWSCTAVSVLWVVLSEGCVAHHGTQFYLDTAILTGVCIVRTSGQSPLTDTRGAGLLLQSRIALSETYFQVPSTVPAVLLVLMPIPSLDPIAHHDTSSGLPKARVRFPVTWVWDLALVAHLSY